MHMLFLLCTTIITLPVLFIVLFYAAVFNIIDLHLPIIPLLDSGSSYPITVITSLWNLTVYNIYDRDLDLSLGIGSHQ